MPHVATSPTDLLATLAGRAHLDGDRVVIDDEAAFRGDGIRDLAWTAAFSDDEATTAIRQGLSARWRATAPPTAISRRGVGDGGSSSMASPNSL